MLNHGSQKAKVPTAEYVYSEVANQGITTRSHSVGVTSFAIFTSLGYLQSVKNLGLFPWEVAGQLLQVVPSKSHVVSAQSSLDEQDVGMAAQ